MEIADSDRYAIRLQGDAAEATLKICDLKGKVIKKLQLSADGEAYIDDIQLERGNYFVIVESKDNGKGKYNTDFTLTASKLTTLYPKIDNSDDSWKMLAQWEGEPLNKNFENWVGIGDATDFFKIDLSDGVDSSERLAITLDEETAWAVEAGIIKIACRNQNGINLALGELESGLLYVKKSLAGSEAVYVDVTLKDKTQDDVDYSFKTSMITLS